MAEIGHNSQTILNGQAQQRLRSFVERTERMIEDRSCINADIREIMAEAKGDGFDVKILRKIVRLRAMDRAKRMEEEALTALYLSAIGEGEL